MAPNQLDQLVREYNRHRRDRSLSKWRRFQLGVQLVVPTMIARFMAAVEKGSMPTTHRPLGVRQAWKQLLPPSRAPVEHWSLGEALPIPPHLLADMKAADAQQLCRTICASATPVSLEVLEQHYFHSNLRYCFDEADDTSVLLEFVAAMEDLPSSVRGPVSLLLLHLSTVHDAKKELVRRSKAGPQTTASQDARVLRDLLRDTLEQLWFLPASLQELSPMILELDLLRRLAKVRATIKSVERQASNQERQAPTTMKAMGVPVRASEFMPTEKLALLDLEQRLFPVIGNQLGITQHIVRCMELLGPWRYDGKSYPRGKADALRGRLRAWRKK